MLSSSPRALKKTLVIVVILAATFLGQDFLTKALELINAVSITAMPQV